MKKTIIILAIIGITSFGATKLLNNNKNKADFKLAKVRKSDIVEIVSATGTINPISSVDVGTQVSGRIEKIYVDYNSKVKKGDLLAEIDSDSFTTNVAQEQANLEVAKAQIMSATADVTYYEKHLKRIKELNQEKYTSDKELDEAIRSYDNAKASLALYKAQANQAQAALDYNKIQLGYTKIISPVDGIIVSKAIEEGQTVAASFETPTLFNVAEDLTKMQIEASIVEADIAKLKEAQLVEFSVDSYPNETFEGIVTQVRNEAITTSNVVTYQVVIDVDNKEFKFKPGMTANVEIITADKKDILVVPNKALRFSIDDGATKYQSQGLWIIENGNPKRIDISTGLYDDNKTEIISDIITENTEIILEKGSFEKPQQGGRMPMKGMRM
ncbi:MAG: efflux RND transporter periplasmic adaptor subunit [Alphaproteobacteria bacterium]